jgi:alpha-amylase/alpha-mannosidase (GH57 family)
MPKPISLPRPARSASRAGRAAAQAAPDGSLRYVCVHGHFYQPPRENPWLETVEVQDSAAPYHDWNDRITAECYAPNGASRIQDIENRIVKIVNNYSRMSFNFGPTLLSWLADNAPRAYRMILDADIASAQRFSGHGSAMAQVYNHIIMPLASRRDAITQIRWGIADFEFRFGRKPEGMWLAETAVNREVLDLMAQQGIRFTVLAPVQCARVRRMGSPGEAEALASADTGALDIDPSTLSGTLTDPGAPLQNLASETRVPATAGASGLAAETAAPKTHGDWIGTPDATVDPTQPYLVELDEGRTINVFFYNGPGSRAIAFEGLLNSGEVFGRRVLDGFHPGSPGCAQLSHVATDGESYGHHHKHGEMALSYAMQWIEDNGHARLTNYGEFLDKFPPTWQAEVAEDTSWSCVHGVERWRSDCGCNGGKPGWNQRWRRPLRDALDFLRDATAPLAEKLAAGLLTDLWATRDAYIQVVLDRSPAAMDLFLAQHATHLLTIDERIKVLELLELERHTQLMYTSCGWFFDEISGIETVQIIAYAGRVLQLAADLFGEPGRALEPRFLEILAQAKSNVPDIGDGAEVYRRYVTGMKIGLEQVGAHYAISSIFRNYPEDGEIFCFDVHRYGHEVFASGRGKVALGRARVRSHITEETEDLCFAVLHLGDQNLSAAVKPYDPDDLATFSTFSDDVRAAIRRANLPEVIRLIDRFFEPQPPASGHAGTTSYSLASLFADEQHRILRTILDQTLSEMEDSLRNIYEDHASLLHYLTESGMSPPPALALAASFALNASLRRALDADNFDPAEVHTLLNRAEADQVKLDATLLGFTASQRMKRAMVKLEVAGSSLAPSAIIPIHHGTNHDLNAAIAIAQTLATMPFEVNLWQAQNIWNDLVRKNEDTDRLPESTPEWKEGFKKLGLALNIAVDRILVEANVAV